MKKPPPTLFDAFEPVEILVPAFRYYLGRMTIATCAFAEALARNWKLLPADVQSIIQRELDRAFTDDDLARLSDSQYKPLGMNCDRESWQLVRNAYACPTHHAPLSPYGHCWRCHYPPMDPAQDAPPYCNGQCGICSCISSPTQADVATPAL